MEDKAHLEPSKLPYQLLKQITNDFHEDRILGSGGFGTVYKGVHEDGGQIAVKILHNMSGLDATEFQKEFKNLRGLKHQNIVELVGFCDELEEEEVQFEGKQVTAVRVRTALCFEYVHNGSLHKRISDECTGLNWRTRYQIIKGVCEGLKYLREGLESPVMHFDLKPDNILLDENMTPKIADFGLSRLFGEENTTKTMTSVGTCGYWPPEYIKHQVISKEFDIFSLGVIIVKIMTGHEGYKCIADMATRKFAKHVHENWRKKLRPILSQTGLQVYCSQVKRCIEIALDCLKPNRQERPSIQHIVSSLKETEIMMGDEWLQNDQFYQDDQEPIVTTEETDCDSWCRPESSLTHGRQIPVRRGDNGISMTLTYIDGLTVGFCQERLLGEGVHAKVYKGFDEYELENIVVKVFRDPEGCGKDRLRRAILQPHYRHHQNIVTLLGFCGDDALYLEKKEGSYVRVVKKNAIICTEYVPNGPLQRYISDISCGLDWYTRYGIIIGTCQGLRFLHEDAKMIHMDLRPRKILLDKDMVPKISDFALSRQFGDEHCKTFTVNSVGTMGYMPPEFINKQVISTHYDIYSLGVIMIEIITGNKYKSESCEMSSKEFIERAHANWRKRLQRTVKDTSAVEAYCRVVKICLEIAFMCIEHDRLKRPTIREIIKALGYGIIPVEQNIDSRQLDVQPLELCFFPLMLSSEGRKKAGMISCSLQLKNKGDDRVAFMLVAKSPKRYLTKKPLCGIVPPRCIYTLTLAMTSKQPLLSDISDFFTLYSIAVGEYELQDIDKGSVTVEYDNFFSKARAMEDGDEVQEVMLKAISDRPADQGTSSSKPNRPTVEIITTPDAREISSMDVHPTEPWILTTHHVGSLRFWNYKTMETLNSFQVTDESVHEAKFIAREKWVVAGDGNGCIHVYSYGKQEDVESFDAHDSCITALAVHPVHSFVISSSDDDHLIKLWDWSKGWKCTQTFRGHTDRVTQVTFNPIDNDSFASASWDGTVKVWSMCSDDPSIIVTLDGKVDSLLCIDYFTRSDRPYLIAGCKDKTAQVWDLGIMEGCVYELEGHAGHITTVKLHPELPMLITGSLDGTVRVWNSTTFKLENIISFNLGAVYAFGCIKGSRRIMVGCHQGFAMMKVTSLVFPWITPKVPRAEPLLHWPKPPQGWRVLSVAGCVGTDGGAGVGMILRSDKGWPKFAEWRYLVNCADALEAEACAAKEGMERALTYTEKPIILQSSCANFLSSVTSMKDDGSKLARIFKEIHALKERREVIFTEISREQNRVAHCLAEHGRSDMITTFCLEHVPDFVSSLVSSDRYAVSVE